MSTLTVDELLALKPCDRYTRERIDELWAGRKSLGPHDIAALGIPPDDRFWALLRMGPKEVWLPAIYRAVDRAVRVHAPTAIDAVGLTAEAAKLRALPPVVDGKTAASASVAADSASAAAYSASADAAYSASAAYRASAAAYRASADAAYSASAADSASAAAYSASAAAASASVAAYSASTVADSASAAAYSADMEITVRDAADCIARAALEGKK